MKKLLITAVLLACIGGALAAEEYSSKTIVFDPPRLSSGCPTSIKLTTKQTIPTSKADDSLLVFYSKNCPFSKQQIQAMQDVAKDTRLPISLIDINDQVTFNKVKLPSELNLSVLPTTIIVYAQEVAVLSQGAMSSDSLMKRYKLAHEATRNRLLDYAQTKAEESISNLSNTNNQYVTHILIKKDGLIESNSTITSFADGRESPLGFGKIEQGNVQTGTSIFVTLNHPIPPDDQRIILDFKATKSELLRMREVVTAEGAIQLSDISTLHTEQKVFVALDEEITLSSKAEGIGYEFSVKVSKAN